MQAEGEEAFERMRQEKYDVVLRERGVRKKGASSYA